MSFCGMRSLPSRIWNWISDSRSSGAVVALCGKILPQLKNFLYPIDKSPSLCYTVPVKTIEAHCTKTTAREEAAKAVGERRGCRSGCRGKAFDWPPGEYPSGCRRNAESYPHPTPHGGSADTRSFVAPSEGAFSMGSESY